MEPWTWLSLSCWRLSAVWFQTNMGLICSIQYSKRHARIQQLILPSFLVAPQFSSIIISSERSRCWQRHSSLTSRILSSQFSIKCLSTRPRLTIREWLVAVAPKCKRRQTKYFLKRQSECISCTTSSWRYFSLSTSTRTSTSRKRSKAGTLSKMRTQCSTARPSWN